MLRLQSFVLAAALLLAPRLASAFGTVEGFYGITRPPDNNFHSAVSSADRQHALLKSSLQIAGGDVLLNFGGPLQIGAIIDTTWKNDSASQTAIGGLLGFRLGAGQLRFDLMGEGGGHHYGNFTKNPDIITASNTSQWLAYVGLRPGVAYHFGSPGAPGFLLGVWGFARWDLTNKHVPVSVAGTGGASADGDVKLGGVSLGATLRAGFDF
jgi:hypothetical protein